MKKILCVIEGYSGLTEANAICLSNIQNYWKSNEIQVDFISIEKERTIVPEGIIPCFIPQKKIYSKLLRNGIKLFNIPIKRPFLVHIITDQIRQQLNSGDYCGILTVVNPIESAEAVAAIKKECNSIIAILYEFDPASNRYKNPHSIFEKWWKARSIKWECKVYKEFDKIIHLKTHKHHFESEIFSELYYKTVYLDVPAFIPRAEKEITEREKKNQNLVLLYAGAFYPKLRNPQRMISIIKKIATKASIEVKIFTGNNMFHSVQEMIGDSSSIILNHYINQNELRIEFDNCDIFLDLGNLESDYLPSKTIQYIGEGKPIIHFCPDREDVTIDYLKKYPLSLIIYEQDDTEEITERILAFFEVIKRKPVCNPMNLKDAFIENCPDYSGAKIIEQFEECLKMIE